MVPIIISIVTSLIILVVGISNIIRIKNERLVGNLLIVEQDGEEPAYMLEIFKGESDKIKPGELVAFAVVTEKITLKKQASL